MIKGPPLKFHGTRDNLLSSYLISLNQEEDRLPGLPEEHSG